MYQSPYAPLIISSLFLLFLGAGIGLTTVRGSGTSGYVQTNKFNLRAPPNRRTEGSENSKAPIKRQPNKEIIEHNKKREIELKVEEKRVELEDEGLSDDAIEEILIKYRAELQETAAKEEEQLAHAPEQRHHETHQVALRKQKQMKKLRDAFGFKDDIEEGRAFNREIQELEKQQRIAEREAKELERQKEREEKEKKRRREEKARQREEEHHMEKERKKTAQQRTSPGTLPENDRSASPDDDSRGAEERKKSPAPDRDDVDRKLVQYSDNDSEDHHHGKRRKRESSSSPSPSRSPPRRGRRRRGSPSPPDSSMETGSSPSR